MTGIFSTTFLLLSFQIASTYSQSNSTNFSSTLSYRFSLSSYEFSESSQPGPVSLSAYTGSSKSTPWVFDDPAIVSDTAPRQSWAKGTAHTTSQTSSAAPHATHQDIFSSKVLRPTANVPTSPSLSQQNTTFSLSGSVASEITVSTHIISKITHVTPNKTTSAQHYANETRIEKVPNSHVHSTNISSSTIGYLDRLGWFTSWSTCSNTTYATDYPIALRTISPECEYGIVIPTDDTDIWGNDIYVDRCLARWCMVSSFDAIVAYTGPMTEYNTIKLTWMDVEFEQAFKSTLTASDEVSEYVSLVYGDIHTSALIYPKFVWDYVTVSRPCCGRCAVRVDNLHLYYWPDQGAKSNTSSGSGLRDDADVPLSYVDENDFTFISPSVYIAFTSLYATDLCGTVGSHPVTYTMAFDSQEITSLTYSQYELTERPNCPNGAIVFDKTISRVMTWSDLQSDCETIELGITYNPAFPMGHIFSNG
ncbi:hypothetical protein CC86DRAFT_65101 [Ophiobolus disseminans]|uniref:Uncharacterized protein n=1 Tax=Ophiobolus disseminans TaxID=1469910 RepID=A0A6A6ZRK7_9PLEO|nr:hypothetical protein CC86DRAFT_65101 [Ophiobolus disseminans]